MRELGFRRVLFLVHRSQLARQTKKAYQNVFSKSVSMGLVGTGNAEYDKDYVFATVQTLRSIVRIRLIVLYWTRRIIHQQTLIRKLCITLHRSYGSV